MTSTRYLMKSVIAFVFVFSTALLMAQSVGGTLSSSDLSKCASGNSGVITLSGQTGAVIRWEYSYAGGDPWTPIAVTSAAYNFSNLAQSISYRAVVQQPGFLPAYSTSIRVDVYDPTVAGSLSGPITVCNGISNAFTLSGNTGTINNWEVSTNSGSSWSIIPASNDSTTKHLSSVINSWYRAVVTNGACLTQRTPIVQITSFSPTVSGTITGTDSICGNTNSVALSLSGQTANQLLWEYAANSSGPWQSTGVATNAYTISNQTSTIFYRVKQKNGACSEAFSPSIEVNHSSNSVGGTISGPNYVCLNDSFALTSVNFTGTILNWNYRLQGSGSWITINATNPILDFAISTAGNYEFAVTVKNGYCNSTLSQVKTLSVKDLPNVGFTVLNACEDANVSFSNTTSGTTTFSWDLGNGSSSSLQHPTTTYSNAGNFNVRLIATSGFGCVDSTSQVVTIFSKPNVSFLTEDSLCAQNTVAFTNLSTAGQGTVTAYSWLNNGVAFSSAQNPTLQINQSGTSVIRLNMQNSFGCSAFKDSLIAIHPKPIAEYTVENSCFGNAVQYQNQSTVTSGSLSYQWSFGDGNTSTVINPAHSFASASAYNTSLIIWSNYGCSDTLITIVTVNPSPVIDFTANPVCKIDSMVFTPMINGVTDYNVNWNFGDGFTSTIENPSHLYSSFGTFTVSLEVVTDSACSAQLTKQVQVYPMPQANFSFNNICEGNTANVDNTSTLANGSFVSEWSFNNEAPVQSFETTHLFSDSGVYPIFLEVTSDNGCIDTLTNWITIYDSPVADFTFSNSCNGVPVQFTNSSTSANGTISQNLWDFGDNTNSTQQNPVKDYMSFGTYEVELIVVSALGCSDTLTQTVQSFEQPIANFAVNAVCFGEETVFENLTLLSAGSFTSEWSFGDGQTSIIVSPSHTYSAAGNYNVELVIVSDQGCSDTILKPIVVYYLPLVFAGNDTITDKGVGVQLQASGAIEYTWTPNNGLSNPQVEDPFANPDSTTTYIVYGESNYGCINSDTITLTIVETYKVVPYNVLTPGGNGKNDTWIVEYIESYPNNSVVIVNEMGHEVFTQESYNNTWDGKNKTGEILPDGTYYFFLKFDDSDVEYKGEILLLRNL